ncbi:MAG: penicillin-binding protein 2, partial [Halomonadaceae bacterium]
AVALASGQYQSDSMINTHPGHMRMGRFTIRDSRNFGEMSLTDIIAKSSNVGISKVAMSLPGQDIQSFFYRLGLGQSTGIGFPGEAVGVLPARSTWRPVEVAALSYGYGLSVNALQLAQSYMVLANGGIRYPVTLLKNSNAPRGERVMSEEVAGEVRKMLRAVVDEGTGGRAAISLYGSAGKTGTVHLVGAGGYDRSRYKALFAGIAPAESPRIAAVIAVDAPTGSEYYGGEVAAPVFSRVMGDALRLLNVQPDSEGEPVMADELLRRLGGQG